MNLERPRLTEWLETNSIKGRVAMALVPVARAALRGVLTMVVGLPYQQAEMVAERVEAKVPKLNLTFLKKVYMVKQYESATDKKLFSEP